jgi:ATP-dependent Lon protease
VGGIRDTVLAAARAGVTTVLLPARNVVDLDEVPAGVRETLTVHPIERVAEVLDLALEPAPARVAAAGRPG